MSVEYYYSINELLTHNRLFSMVVGSRGKGKSTQGLKLGIERFKKGKGKFIYLRRYKTELKPLKQDNKLFSIPALQDEFPDDELEVKGDILYCNKKVCGYMLALSVCCGKKSIPYTDVNLVLFDEFIIDTKKSTYHYLPNEVISFLEFFNTVNRIRDNCIAVFLSNNISDYNPYFLFFNITPKLIKNQETGEYEYKRFNHIKQDICVEYIPSDEQFKEAVYNTRFGRLIKGTAYADYAVENKPLKPETNLFVEKKQGTAHYYCTLRYNDKNYGVWVDMVKGKFYISYDTDTYYGHTYCLTLEDHTPNTLLITRKNGILKSLSDNFKLGNVFYESMKIKNESSDALKLLI